MVLFTTKVKNIKDADHNDGDVDGMCKRAFRIVHAFSIFLKYYFPL